MEGKSGEVFSRVGLKDYENEGFGYIFVKRIEGRPA
jgi:hypothetical protein